MNYLFAPGVQEPRALFLRSNTGAGACPSRCGVSALAHTGLLRLHCTDLETGGGTPTGNAPGKLRSQGNASFREHPQTLPRELLLCLPPARLAFDSNDLAFHSLSLYFSTIISFANFISSVKKFPRLSSVLCFSVFPRPPSPVLSTVTAQSLQVSGEMNQAHDTLVFLYARAGVVRLGSMEPYEPTDSTKQ